MKNNKILLEIIVFIIFIVYNVIIFTISPNMTVVFWIAYMFTIVSFILLSVNIMLVFNSKKSNRETYYNLLNFIISVIYLMAQIILGSFFTIFYNMPLKMSIILELIILSIYVIVNILLLVGRKYINNIEENTREKVLCVNLLSNDIDSMIDKTSDNILKKTLVNLKTNIEASDPMSNDSLKMIEQNIVKKIDNLSDIIITNDIARVEPIIDEINQILRERNRKCKILKS